MIGIDSSPNSEKMSRSPLTGGCSPAPPMMSEEPRIGEGLSSYSCCWYWKPTASDIGPAGRFMISFAATPSITHAVVLAWRTSPMIWVEFNAAMPAAS